MVELRKYIDLFSLFFYLLFEVSYMSKNPEETEITFAPEDKTAIEADSDQAQSNIEEKRSSGKRKKSRKKEKKNLNNRKRQRKRHRKKPPNRRRQMKKNSKLN